MEIYKSWEFLGLFTIYAQICHTEMSSCEVGKNIGSSTVGTKIICHHVQCGFRRVGTDIFLCNTMVGTADGDSLYRGVLK